ncbi:acetylhydrolase [Micromonospora sp. WP24]|uniref:alpha/beta hydrolase family protein n=1 Tax=Micromonospora sp. WP24 TaxID=2604469 RepID=UPI0011D38D1E|nr:acetylhydrolase [Micromonospora sp. WP24]TYC00274.1 acetylhydrolase [Micromonospora sp. WP24]
MTTALTRRRLLTTALATGVAVPLGARWAAPAQAASGPARLTLPAPTGPHRVGTVPLHLVDRSRPDPIAGPGHHRELMVSVWYPAGRDAWRHPVAPWLPAAPMAALLAANGFDADVVTAPRTAGHEGAPVFKAAGRRPVVVFSHGAGGHRSETTIVVQELVSHGYVAVTVDHPYGSFGESPDGTPTVPDGDVSVTPWDHAHDIQFVLDRIEDLATGRNPDAQCRPLPAGLGAAIDPRRIGMFGWSKGGTATALVMNADPRVRAGLSLDGPMLSQPPVADLDRPFMLMTAVFIPGAEESGVAEFWPLLRGWRRQVHVDGATHGAYCDSQWLIPQLASIIGMSDDDLAGWIGTLDPFRAVRIQQAYPLAFFEQHLRHRRQRLLNGPRAAFPEVQFVH